MVPELPYDIWQKIFLQAAKREREEWWGSLSDVEREYKEWPMFDDELGEMMYINVFEPC